MKYIFQKIFFEKYFSNFFFKKYFSRNIFREIFFENVFIEKYFSKNIFRKIFFETYFSKNICRNILVEKYFSKKVCGGDCRGIRVLWGTTTSNRDYALGSTTMLWTYVRLRLWLYSRPFLSVGYIPYKLRLRTLQIRKSVGYENPTAAVPYKL